MSSRTVSHRPPLHSRADVTLRHHKITTDARLAWLAVLSHAPWREVRPTWATNRTLAEDVAFDLRRTRNGLDELQGLGVLRRDMGRRPGATRSYGRVWVPSLESPAKVLIPARHHMHALWALGRSATPRPGALVSTAAIAYVLACDHADRRIFEPEWIGCGMTAFRQALGAAKGSSWSRRITILCDLEILARDGRRLMVMPPCSWSPTLRAMASVRRVDSPRPPEPPVCEPPPWWDEEGMTGTG